MRPRPVVDWPRRAAIVAHDRELAATGITTVFDAICIGGIQSKYPMRFGRYGRDAANHLHALRKSDHLKISHHLHLRAEMCSESLTE